MYTHTFPRVPMDSEDGLWEGQFSPFTTWALRVKFSSSGLVTSAFIHPSSCLVSPQSTLPSFVVHRETLSFISSQTKLKWNTVCPECWWGALNPCVPVQQRPSSSEPVQGMWRWFYPESVRQAPDVSVLCMYFWVPGKRGISEEESPQEEVISTHCYFINS